MHWLLRKGLVGGALLFGVLWVCLLSPLAPTSRDAPAADSSVFLTIGRGLLEGRLPYADFFDHKGPLLYALNAAGLAAGDLAGMPRGWGGVWCVEFAALLAAAFFAYKTARLFAPTFPATLAAVVNFLCLGAFFYQGNLPEEYALPLVFSSLFLYLRHFLKGAEFRRWEILALGASAGASLLLKPNLFAVWATFSAVYCLGALWEKNARRAFAYAGFFFAGVAAALAPFLMGIALAGAFPEFVAQYWTFNLKYASHSNSFLTSLHNFFSIANRMHIWGVLLVAFYLTLRFRNKREFPAFLAWFLSIPLAMAMFANSPHLGERNFMIMIPLYLPALAFLAAAMHAHFAQLRPGVLRFALPCAVFFGTFYPAIRQGGTDLVNSFKDGYERPNPLSEIKLARLREKVSAIAEKGGAVTVMGNNCGVYYSTNNPPLSKYIYQYPPIKVAPQILETYQREVLEKRPALVFIAWPYMTAIPNANINYTKLREDYPDVAKLLLDSGEYQLLWTEHGLAEVFARKTSVEKNGGRQ